MREMKLWLAGTYEDGAGFFDVASPYDGRVVSRVALAAPEQLEEAAAAAARAASVMEALSAEKRAGVLARAAALIVEREQELVQAMIEEAGKPAGLARGEVLRARDTFLASADVARYPQVVAKDLSGFSSGAGSLALVRRVPIGPVLAVTPFNFPLNLVAHKVAPAVAAGCPIVVKPASQTPSPALILAEILGAAGLPEGGLSVMPCRGADAAPLVEDGRFRLLSFTGSGEVGWQLKRQAWDKRVALELGGNAAVVVEPDAGDLGEVARKIALASYAYAGQSCISVQRILVHYESYAALKRRLIHETEAIACGDPADTMNVCGPLIDASNAERVERWIGDAVGAGGRLLSGGQRDGNFVRPALLDEVPGDQPVVESEVFGPVAVLIAYEDFEQALDIVNDSRYGLQAGIFSQDISKVRRAWDRLEVGGLIQGDVPTWRSDPMPYGGVKDSGVGKEGPGWTYLEMTEERLLVLR